MRNLDRAACIMILGGAFPIAIAIFLLHLSKPSLLMGDPSVFLKKVASSQYDRSISEAESRPDRGAKSFSLVSMANLFQGQAS